MKAVIQRVKSASVTINGEETARIGKGFLILLGVNETDSKEQADILADKCSVLRVFEDENGKMNLSIDDVEGEFLIVSNFTLYADCRKGRRPSFVKAARPEVSEPLYEYFVERVRSHGRPVKTGEFGADMKIGIVNDGPVTLVLDTAELE